MMAVANDEWNGELTQFLDRLPPRPCLVPPAPSFCSVCGSINGPVARTCKFFALRHERERGQTFIELAQKRRPDTFEIELDFEEEEEELPDAQMFEFSRPATTTAIKGKVRPVAAPSVEKPVEIEVYEAEVVEVVEEPVAGPAPKPAPAEDAGALARAEDETRRLEAELVEKQARTERENERRRAEERQAAEKAELERKEREEREAAEKAELERRAREEREAAEKAELERRAQEEARTREAAKPAAPKAADNQVLSREEEERLEREIEEELAKAGLASAQAEKAPSPAAPGRQPGQAIPPDQVIAPIYSQPILKIITPEGESPKMQPLPPPPPKPEAPAPLPPVEEPPAQPPAPGEPPKAPEPQKPAGEKPSPPAAPAQKEPAPAPGQRRTGGLYGIFRKAPKEQPKPDGDKNAVDEELAKRLKKEGK